LDKKQFYGFGNYLTDGGETLGAKIMFISADNEKTARGLMVNELAKEGNLVPNSLMVFAGNTIPAEWLMAAALRSEEATWSSGTVPAMPILHKKELLN